MKTLYKVSVRNASIILRYLTIGQPVSLQGLRDAGLNPDITDRVLRNTLKNLVNQGYASRSREKTKQGTAVFYTLLRDVKPHSKVDSQELTADLVSCLSSREWISEEILNPVGVALRDLVTLGLVKEQLKDGVKHYQVLSQSNL